MGAVGKHFPGHGHVRADSHAELPVDVRRYADIEQADIVPFMRLMRAGLPAIMPAHIVFSDVDSRPAGFSAVWLKRILRDELGFDGLVFSDDLSMEGARTLGGITERVQAALEAGCDMVLTCNDHPAADDLLARWQPAPQPDLARRAERMAGR